MVDDKTILLAALDEAQAAFVKVNPMPSLLGSSPDGEILGPLEMAIEQCAAYQSVAGQVLFCGGSGPVLHAGPLASLLFSKGAWPTDNKDGAVDWLLKLLRTREATVLVKAAIWGVQVDQTVALAPATRLMPFADLPESYMKGRLEERARSLYDGSAWMAPTHYDLPDAALVEVVPQFPFIRSDGEAFQRMNDLEERLNDIGALIQATATGAPIAVACWFEYEDPDLEYAEWEHTFSWLLPEVHPRVQRGSVVGAGRIRANVSNFDALGPARQADLLRSMNRFRLSQSRRETTDRILDLTLAFEIAVSGPGGEQAPPNYKVSVRTAQAVGGALPDRQRIRTSVGSLYALRNQATHGGQLKPKAGETPEGVIAACGSIFMELMTRLLSINGLPDWPAIELQALPRLEDAATAKRNAAIHLITSEYAPLIRDHVLPAVAKSRGRPWMEQLSEYFLRKSTRHLEAVCALVTESFGEDGLIIGRTLLEHSLYLAWVAAAGSPALQDERAQHFLFDGDRQRFEKRRELGRLKDEGKCLAWVDPLLTAEIETPAMAKPASFTSLPSLKRMAEELGGEFECYFHFVYWSVSKLAHPSGMGSHSYYLDDDGSEAWRALALAFPQHALMTANTLAMFNDDELQSAVEQLARRFIALDSSSEPGAAERHA